MNEIDELTINWDRCVYVDDEIDEELVKRLTPQILSFRQSSADPITVAINSPGGSLASMDTLLGLLTGPNQDRVSGSIITVVTNKAYSAAANLLAFGDYAVALPHAEILFHDVRFGGLRDVTPDKALRAAKNLQSANDDMSLRLANRVFRRLMWNYIDLKNSFDEVVTLFPDKYAKYQEKLNACDIKPNPTVIFDPAKYAVTIFRYLQPINEVIVDQALEHLGRWGGAMGLSALIPKYSAGSEESKTFGLLDGALKLYRAMSGTTDSDPSFGATEREDDLALFLTLVVSHLSSSKAKATAITMERALDDFKLVQSLNNPLHKLTASKLMRRHSSMFFSTDAQVVLASDDDAAKASIHAQAAPLVAAMWHICVLMCRELFNGEHTLQPVESQVLGLVDEVPGETILGTKRQFRVDQKAREAVEKKVAV